MFAECNAQIAIATLILLHLLASIAVFLLVLVHYEE